jgi:cobalt-zinc-cadmium efflux system protein
LHVWSLTPDEPVLTAHVVLHPGSHGTEVARRVGERIHEAHGIGHVTIQPESPPPEKKLVPLRIPKNGEGEPGPPDGAFDEPETAT